LITTRTAFLTTVVLLLAGAWQAPADQLSPVADATVRHDIWGRTFIDPTANSPIYANRNPVNDDRAILEFPLSSIPAGSLVTSARLQIFVNQAGGTLGTTGTFALCGYPGDGLITGSDFGNDQLVLQTFKEIVPPTWGWQTFDVTAFVLNGVGDGDAFGGFLFRALDENIGIGFASVDDISVNARPVLDVQFTPIPEPEVAALVFAAGVLIVFWRR
jgi:hypothetical protein